MSRPMALLRGSLFVSGLQSVSAWWDEGHMMVARVAQEYVEELKLLRLNRTLQYRPQDSISNGFGDLASAAVWLDQVKCKPAAERDPWCLGLEEQPNMDLFFTWHLAKVEAYNPQGIELPLKARIGIDPPDDRRPSSVTAFMHVQETLALASSQSHENFRFQLKVFLHAFGDVHQPLHTTDFWDDGPSFSGGDSGGNRVQTTIPSMGNLHAIWDAAGGLYTHNMNRHDDSVQQDLPQKVARLVKEFPPQFFIDAGRLSPHWNNASMNYGVPTDPSNVSVIIDWIKDTYTLVPEVYGEYLRGTYVRNPNVTAAPYSPSDQYMADVRRLSKQQIALGGYRCASWLNAYANYLPPPRGPYFIGLTRQITFLEIIGGIALGMVMGAWGAFLILVVQSKYRQSKREVRPLAAS